MILDRILFHGHLHEDEHLEYVVHEHWLTVWGKGFKSAFFGIATPVVLFLIFPTEAAFWIFGVWAAIGTIWFFYEMAKWYFDVLLVTNFGIIDLDWRGIFDKSSTRVDYGSIIGVSYEKVGALQNLFDFGPLIVEIEHTGERQISLPNAASPLEAEEKILTLKEKFISQRGMENEEALKEILSQMVAHHLEKKHHEKLADML